MNRLERIVYDVLKDNTGLKKSVKKIYQSVYLLQKPDRIQCEFKISTAKGYFFGFHDKTPWNHNNSFILAHKLKDNSVNLPGKTDEAGIGYFSDQDLKNFHSLGSTKCWNWQQGSMLQWLGDKNHIIFNDWRDNKIKAVVIDLQGTLVKELSIPFGAVSHDGRILASFDFERLNHGMPGYGYANQDIHFSTADSDIPTNHGMLLFDIEREDVLYKISIADLNEKLGERRITNGYVFVTHFLFSPSGQRVLFLLRSFEKGRRLISRMISCKVDGSEFHVFPTGDMVSHITWVRESQVLAYCSDMGETDGYYLYNDKSPEFSRVGENDYSYDGHPQFSPVNESFVTDSYPDRRRLQELSVYNLKNSIKKLIGKFYSPMIYMDELRCDLHPRWDRLGEKICIDSTYDGERAISIIDLNTRV